ncbi:MAG: endonuclease MutS2, partial [Rikenellaceae bacterium]
MIYPSNFEQKIGFDRLREQVISKCVTLGGERKVAEQSFVSEQRVIEERLNISHEMVAMLRMERGFSVGEYTNIDGVISKLSIEGSFLDVEEVVVLRRARR